MISLNSLSCQGTFEREGKVPTYKPCMTCRSCFAVLHRAAPEASRSEKKRVQKRKISRSRPDMRMLCHCRRSRTVIPVRDAASTSVLCRYYCRASACCRQVNGKLLCISSAEENVKLCKKIFYCALTHTFKFCLVIFFFKF